MFSSIKTPTQDYKLEDIQHVHYVKGQLPCQVKAYRFVYFSRLRVQSTLYKRQRRKRASAPSSQIGMYSKCSYNGQCIKPGLQSFLCQCSASCS